jgi:hypothetical protein
MTRNFTKITAALVATLTISAAAASFTTDTASARMGGERMSMGHSHGHMGHGHRHGGYGFGRGAAIGFGAAIVGAAIVAAANQPYAESYNPQTGERVRSEGKPGRHVVTRTDGKGNKNQVANKPQPDSASSTDPKTGITTTSISNGNGTRTVVTTDSSGKVLNSEVVN